MTAARNNWVLGKGQVNDPNSKHLKLQEPGQWYHPKSQNIPDFSTCVNFLHKTNTFLNTDFILWLDFFISFNEFWIDYFELFCMLCSPQIQEYCFYWNKFWINDYEFFTSIVLCTWLRYYTCILKTVQYYGLKIFEHSSFKKYPVLTWD